MADRTQTEARAARLAAALRINLARRKQRDRASSAELPVEAKSGGAVDATQGAAPAD